MDQIEVRLFSKQDRNGDEYFIGSTELPASVDLSEVTFVFFLPIEGETKGSLKIRPRQPRRAPSTHDAVEQTDD